MRKELQNKRKKRHRAVCMSVEEVLVSCHVLAVIIDFKTLPTMYRFYFMNASGTYLFGLLQNSMIKAKLQITKKNKTKLTSAYTDKFWPR